MYHATPDFDEVRALSLARPAGELARDELFWGRVRREYSVPTDFVQLEYGFYHPSCNAVLEAEIAAMKRGQRRGSHYKRNDMLADRDVARADLASLAGVSPEEVALTRSSTETFNIIVNGLPLSTGDEIIHGDQDYPSVVEALEQRAARDKIVLKCAAVPLDPATDEEVIEAFAKVVTPRTRAILFTHVINHTGQVLPLQKLCAFARALKLLIIVDAAHSFAQIPIDIRALDCDYFGSSLHKWLGAPLGTGFLFVRRDRIALHAPFFADTRTPKDNIRKLEHYGDSADSTHVGMREAIRWHNAIGTEAKRERLRFLQRRWSQVARTLPEIEVLTPADPARQCALGLFSVRGRAPLEVVRELYDGHRIFVNAILHPIVSGIRVTPGVCTSLAEIDRLITALKALSDREHRRGKRR